MAGRRGTIGRWLGVFAGGLVAGVGLAALDPRLVAARGGASRRPPAAGGRQLHSPAEISPRGWREVVVRAARDFGTDNIAAAAAGATFYVLLSLFPAVSAFVSLYGLVADAADARRQVLSMAGLLPGGAVTVLSDQLARLAATDHGRLGAAFAVSLLFSLWSSNAGVKALLAALNIAYEARETRGFLRLNLLSLGITAGGILLAVLALAGVVAVPHVIAALGLARLGLLAWLRWPVFLIATSLLLSALYRWGPCRAQGHWRWITPGGGFAAVSWVVMSALFTWYVSNFGHYDKTYGSLGAIVGFLTWIWLSLMVVLFGAELNSEIEKQAGASRPVATGERLQGRA